MAVTTFAQKINNVHHPLRPSLHYPSITLVVNIMYIRILCVDLNIFIFSTGYLYMYKACDKFIYDRVDRLRR